MTVPKCSPSLALRTALLGILFIAFGCGGDRSEQPGTPSTPSVSATPGTETPDPGGSVVTVDMVTDGEGNYYEPADFSVRRGDVVRFVLRSGVHNARFVPDSNAGKSRLPAEVPYLQLPGQTYDIKVDVEPGTYYYHCDPHALLGMVGHMTVTP